MVYGFTDHFSAGLFLNAGMLLTNLLSNAIRHNQPDGEIRIKLCRKDLHISNTGISSFENRILF
ncbi:MAG: ATP-binding protein, partial [Bacteroidales bacterium]|nr:ATP-binding protein [Bacteroidales bacterium]